MRFIILITLLFAPFEFIKAQNEVVHPQDKFIPYLNEFEKDNVNLIDTNKIYTPNLYSQIGNAEKMYQIGKQKGSAYEILGRITAVVTDQNKNIYVLDGRKNTVLVYNASGKFLYQFGRGGRGPGEFQSPTDMKMDSQENIYIADRFYLIHKFAKQNGRYTHQKDIKIDVIPDGFCIMNKKIYVRGLKAGRSKKISYDTIHAYQLADGKSLFSFGKPYNAENLLVKKQLSDGKFVCDDITNTIISTFDMMPYLFGYTERGQIKWISEITPFKSRPIIEKYGSGPPSITLKSTDYPTDNIENLQITKDGELIVQVSHGPRGFNTNGKGLKVITSVIASQSGTGLDNMQLNAPLLLFDDSRFYVNGILNFGYPVIVAYEN